MRYQVELIGGNRRDYYMYEVMDTSAHPPLIVCVARKTDADRIAALLNADDAVERRNAA